MRRRFRWWTIACVVAVLVLAGAGIASWLALRAYGPLLARERIEQALAGALDRPVRIERLVISPWLGRVTALNLTIGGGPAREGEPMLRVGTLQVQVGVSSLWRREVVLSRILLRDFTLRLQPGGGGRPAPPPLIPERLEVGPVSVRIRMVQLAGGRVIYQDAAGGLRVDAQGASATARPADGGMDVTVRIATLRVQSPAVRQVAEEVEGQGRVLPNLLALRRLTARWNGRALRVSGEVRRPFDAPELELTLGGSVDLSPLAQGAGIGWKVAGAAEVEADVRGRLDLPRISARVAIPELTAGPVTARQVGLRGQWSQGTLSLSQVEARLLGGLLRGSLVTRPDRPAETRATLALRDVSLAALEAFSPFPPGLRGDLSLTATLAGDPRRLDEVRGNVRVEARRLRLPGEIGRIGAGIVEAEAAFRGADVTLSRLVTDWPGLQSEVTGRLVLHGPLALRMRVASDLATLGRLGDLGPLAGRATLGAEISGRWDRPEVRGRFEVPALTVAGTRVDRVAVAFQLAGDSLHVHSATGILGRSAVAASGTASWPADIGARLADLQRAVRFQVDVRAPSFRWEDLDPLLPPEFRGSGRLDVSARLQGTPAAWRGTGTIQAARLVLPRDLGVGELRAAFAVDPDGLSVTRLQARLRGVPLQGAGTWSRAGRGRASMEAGPVDLASLPAIPPQLGLRGTGRARLQVSADMGTVTGSGLVELERVSLTDLPLGDGTIHITAQAGALRADLAFPEARLTGSVTGRLDPGGSLDVRLAVVDMAMPPLLRQRAQASGLALDGRASGRAELLVPLADPSAARGTLTLDPVRLVVAGEAWTNPDPVVLRWMDGTLQVAHLAFAGRVGKVSASGQYRPAGPLDLEARGQFPLALVPLFWRGAEEAAGTLDLTIHVAGTPAAPTITGEGRVLDGQLKIRDYPETLRSLRAHFLLTPGGVRLVEAVGSLGPGRFQASGQVNLQGRQVGLYRFAVTGRDISVMPMDGLHTLWDLNLELAGLGPRARVTGQGRLVRGAYTGQFSLLSLLLARRPGAAAASSSGLPIRLRLTLDDNLSVQTNLARLKVDGTVNLEGTTSQPLLFGGLESHEGWIMFRKQRFTVVSATARFTDPRRVDPVLDVTATAQIQSYDVTMHLTGRAEDLSLRLSSTPPLAEQDLLSLVALGVTPGQIGRSAPGILAGEVGRLLVENLLGTEGSAFGLDRINVGTVEEAGQQRMQVDARLTQDIRLIYTQTLTGSEKRVLRVEYQVFGPLILAGEQDFGGGYGGDVLVRLRFR